VLLYESKDMYSQTCVTFMAFDFKKAEVEVVETR